MILVEQQDQDLAVEQNERVDSYVRDLVAAQLRLYSVYSARQPFQHGWISLHKEASPTPCMNIKPDSELVIDDDMPYVGRLPLLRRASIELSIDGDFGISLPTTSVIYDTVGRLIKEAKSLNNVHDRNVEHNPRPLLSHAELLSVAPI